MAASGRMMSKPGSRPPSLPGGLVALLLGVVTLLPCLSPAFAFEFRANHPQSPCLDQFRKPRIKRGAGVAQAARRHSNGMHDGAPLLFDGSQGRPAVFCLIEKAGSTRWKQVFLKAMGASEEAVRLPHLSSVLRNGEPFWPHATEIPTKQALRNASVPRFVFVRSPYSRLLSAYLSKLSKGNWSNRMLYSNHEFDSLLDVSKLTASPSDFAALVEDLHRLVKRFGWGGQYVDKHFLPTSLRCGFNVGLQYDYTLPVESIDSWYPALVNMLGLQDVVNTGWGNLYAAGKKAALEDTTPVPDCFYTVNGRSCKETERLFESPHRCSHQRGPHGGDVDGVFHGYSRATDAQAKLHRYYTPRLAELVEDLYAEDFRSFGYERMRFEYGL